MNRSVPPTLETVLKQAQQLSPAARLQLAEKLLRPAEGDVQAIVLSVRRFGNTTQKRFQELMDRSSEGALTAQERRELASLVARYEELMLLNSEALLRATSPELFDSLGRVIQERLDRALHRKIRGKKSDKV